MGIFQRIFKKKQTDEDLSKEEFERRNNEYKKELEKLTSLIESSIKMYNSTACPCGFPRFQQIVGIDCSNYGDSFKCVETELLINKSKRFFHIEPSDRKDENVNEKWVCKTCGSKYEYGWQDFSIAVERQKLELCDLKTVQVGEKQRHPIPLYLGLRGHSYPPKSEITAVEFEEFERYILEK